MVRKAVPRVLEGSDPSRCPLDDVWLCLPEAVCQGSCFAGEIGDEVAVISHKAQEMLQLLLLCGAGVLLQCEDLVGQGFLAPSTH